MKTDLKKIVSISGQPGLFLYVAQANRGLIVESLQTKRRMAVGASARVSALSDISVYTTSEEIPLRQVFENIHNLLGDEEPLSSKADPKQIKAFFEKALPDYDEDRFYVSHMKKVLDWYKALKDFASLDFEQEEETAEATETAE